LISLSQTRQTTGRISADQYGAARTGTQYVPGNMMMPSCSPQHDRHACCERIHTQVFFISVFNPFAVSVHPVFIHLIRARLTGPTDTDAQARFVHPPRRMRQRSLQIPAWPHAPWRTRRGVACDSVVRDQARKVAFRPTRTTKKGQCSQRQREKEGNQFVAHLDISRILIPMSSCALPHPELKDPRPSESSARSPPEPGSGLPPTITLSFPVWRGRL